MIFTYDGKYYEWERFIDLTNNDIRNEISKNLNPKTKQEFGELYLGELDKRFGKYAVEEFMAYQFETEFEQEINGKTYQVAKADVVYVADPDGEEAESSDQLYKEDVEVNLMHDELLGYFLYIYFYSGESDQIIPISDNLAMIWGKRYMDKESYLENFNNNY